MPVFRTRLLAVCLLTAAVFGCSGKNKVSEPDAPPDSGAVDAVGETVSLARAEVSKGDELASRGNWAEARGHYDRAVDLLLTVPGGVESSEEVSNLYDTILGTIYETERASVEAGREVRQEQAEPAAVDDLTSDAALETIAENEGGEVAATDLPEVTYDIPIVMNARVRSIIEMYQLRRHDWFQSALNRKAQHEGMIRRIFAEEGVPQDLIYLAMVESAYKTRAVSRAGARGMWQFIRGTGRLYGLNQTFWVDDRFNPEKATRAAARHLKDLYEDFEDWYLVMAAYNSGPRRVERAIRRTGSRDFWTHAKRRVLPRETRSYIPLILAAIVVGKNPEAYGFDPPEPAPMEYDVVRLDHPVDLATAAESAGVSVEDMKALNPELRRWVTPLEQSDYPLRVPVGTQETFRVALAAIPADERVRFGTHVVQRGDTLSRIANRYGTSIDALTAANQIQRRSLIHPGQVLTVPVPPGSGAERIRSVQQREVVAENGQDVYVVQRGDTLGEISTSFKMSLGQLRALNGMASSANRIHPGQKLIVTARVAAAMDRGAAARAPSSDSLTTGHYVVQPGDTLGQIAEAHGMGLSVLRGLNDMGGGRTRIYPGQRLSVRAAAGATAGDGGSGPIRYRIRRGDTLSKIAQRFGVSIQEIRDWNSIRSDQIVAGDRLTIHVRTGTN